MKKVNLVCVGRIKEKFLADGIAEYAKRLTRFCDFTFTELADVAGEDEVKKESDAILSKLRGYVIVCDIGGKTLSSPELSAAMENAYLRTPEITFVIGGSEGFDDRVRKKADLRMSFGRVTFPHQLMRLILTEQIYRAFNIAAGTPYHK